MLEENWKRCVAEDGVLRFALLHTGLVWLCCIPGTWPYMEFPVPRCVSRAFCSAFLHLATISLPLCSFAWNMYCGSTKRQKHMLFVFSSR